MIRVEGVLWAEKEGEKGKRKHPRVQKSQQGRNTHWWGNRVVIVGRSEGGASVCGHRVMSGGDGRGGNTRTNTRVCGRGKEFFGGGGVNCKSSTHLSRSGKNLSRS